MRKKEGGTAAAASFIYSQKPLSGGRRHRSRERVLEHGDRELWRCGGESNTRDIEGVWPVIERCARFEIGAPQRWHRWSQAAKWATIGE